MKKLLQISWFKKNRTPSSITNLFSSCQSKVRYWVGPWASGGGGTVTRLRHWSLQPEHLPRHVIARCWTLLAHIPSGTGTAVDVTPADNYVPIFHTEEPPPSISRRIKTYKQYLFQTKGNTLRPMTFQVFNDIVDSGQVIPLLYYLNVNS